jgi:hypothetical protein
MQRRTGSGDAENLRVARARGKLLIFWERRKRSRCPTHGGGIRGAISARTTELPAIALTTAGNDFGFEQIFARQVKAVVVLSGGVEPKSLPSGFAVSDAAIFSFREFALGRWRFFLQRCRFYWHSFPEMSGKLRFVDLIRVLDRRRQRRRRNARRDA